MPTVRHRPPLTRRPASAITDKESLFRVGIALRVGFSAIDEPLLPVGGINQEFLCGAQCGETDSGPSAQTLQPLILPCDQVERVSLHNCRLFLVRLPENFGFVCDSIDLTQTDRSVGCFS